MAKGRRSEDIKIENGDSVVYCRTPIGNFKGIWAGNVDIIHDSKQNCLWR